MIRAIIVEGLGKQFTKYHQHKPRTLMEAFLSGWRYSKPKERFWALQDVGFQVFSGEMLGIIGNNGAGKSTLLRLLGGVSMPDQGRVRVKGRISALLDLGANLHPDLTGRENSLVNGVISGLTTKEVLKRLETIIEFAELTSFIDNPVRTYSSGMKMRLAFAVAIHTDPDVLLVDEFLSVGDKRFQNKCLEKISQLKQQGTAIVFISHNTEQIRQICDRAIWLHQGRICSQGDPISVVNQYLFQVDSNLDPKEATSYAQQIVIRKVSLWDRQQQLIFEIDSGDALTVAIEYQAFQTIVHPTFVVSITDETNCLCFQTNTKAHCLCLSQVDGLGQLQLNIERLDLNSGEYFVNVGIYPELSDGIYDQHWHAYPFLVRSPIQIKSLLYPPHQWENIVNS